MIFANLTDYLGKSSTRGPFYLIHNLDQFSRVRGTIRGNYFHSPIEVAIDNEMILFNRRTKGPTCSRKFFLKESRKEPYMWR